MVKELKGKSRVEWNNSELRNIRQEDVSFYYDVIGVSRGQQLKELFRFLIFSGTTVFLFEEFQISD